MLTREREREREREISLTQGLVAIVDAGDYVWLSKWKWFAKVGGCGGDAYAARSVRINGKVKTVRMHRLIMDAPDGMEVDHINGNTMDNRRCNLRIVSKSENLANRNYGKYASCTN